MKFYIGTVLLLTSSLLAQTPPLPDLYAIPEDLVIPPVTEGAPSAGHRVRQTTAGWEGTEVHHVLYLPRDWEAGKTWPVIVEYAGNGGYSNKHGDVSHGTVDGSRLGYGVSGGEGCLWLCLPYVEKTEGTKQNAIKWWGDVEETKRYCHATLKNVCAKYGGDPERVVLAGFSRGSIACNYIGLHDDEVAKLWCGFICHSHYDGVLTSWPYGGADREAALVRLKRLKGRPQFISHEGSVQATENWLRSTRETADWTFVPLPFRNHTDAWVLRDLPERKRLRDWFSRVVEKK
ncbi:hypothetical protein WJU23_01530 [Prosthecobacter sp. SYSU 5D2]|uniref:hypothetical protein n=1 Tax=Prosthecobacter sp. SYSU 5D2 TaxID=3134134 RepID=UPI0031FF343B